MRRHDQSPRSVVLGRAVAAGVLGTGVMTAFQKLVEMPLSGRGDSYAPADLAERITPISTDTEQGRRRLNLTTHFALGGMWGAAYGVAALRGLSGQRAVNAVFAVVYTGDLVLNTALGLYKPSSWSAKDVVVDVVDKYVQAQATGLIFDRALDPRR